MEACPNCGGSGIVRPSGDRACRECGAVWKVTVKPKEMPKP